MADTNIPAFATTLADLPKRLRKGLNAEQHGRDNTMLIHHADDQTKIIGRLTKKANGRYSFEVFDGAYAVEEIDQAKVITDGRTTTPLRAISLARQFAAAHKPK